MNVMTTLRKKDLIFEAASLVDHEWPKKCPKKTEKLDFASELVINNVEDYAKEFKGLIKADPGKIMSEDCWRACLELIDLKEQITALQRRVRTLEKKVKGDDVTEKQVIDGQKVVAKRHIPGLQEIIDQNFGPRFSMLSPDGHCKMIRQLHFRAGYVVEPCQYYTYKLET